MVAGLKRGTPVRGHMETVVVGFGGSVVAPAELDIAFLRNLATHIRAWSSQRRLFVVVGGGQAARRYIRAARELGVPEEELDRIGIMATRLNAQLIDSLVHDPTLGVPRGIPATPAEAADLARDGHVVVMGGTDPGHSTDYVAAELALTTGADRLVIATNVDGVYTADPRTHPDAERRERLTFRQLLDIIKEVKWTQAGAPGVIDAPASLLIARNGLTTHVVEGHDLENVGQAVRGEAFNGTLVAGPKVPA